ncbi:peptide chain release factor N(5)-glutamine methyltransferase [Deinococcus lacus]|uniref:peptide chain release factor N(5)-glutamine methyltransferase n=1 Tax=Deinococcus lacus TaxID=392561 RepID=A0ABW1YCF1_9DEIO
MQPLTVQQALEQARAALASAGIVSAPAEARALVQHVLQSTPAGLLLRGPETLTTEQQQQFDRLLEARTARWPLQYLLGTEWGGLTLRCDARALVPRPETEWLLHLCTQRPAPARILDIGTGSGALALALQARWPSAQVTATDLSAEALSLAQENAVLSGISGVEWRLGDLLAGAVGPFDLVVSNPPYLPEADQAAAEPEVQHDPALALYSGPDGLTLARRLLASTLTHLARPGGTLWLELDPRNVLKLAAEARASGWQVAVHPDLTGRLRFLELQPATL